MKKLIPLLSLMLLLGCSTPEKTARDVIAASRGAIVAAQAQYHDQCVATPTAQPCALITHAIQAQHLAIDALNIYCTFTPTTPAETKCAPVKAALPGLQTALTDLNTIILDVQAIVGRRPAPPTT